MFSSEILAREYNKNIKIYNLIIEDEKVDKKIKIKYKKYLEERKKEIELEKSELKKLLADLREMYEKEVNNYLKIEIEKNINIIIKKLDIKNKI